MANETMERDEVYTSAEVAHLLGVSKTTVRVLVTTGELNALPASPFVRRNPRLLIPREELRRFFAATGLDPDRYLPPPARRVG